MASAAPRFRYEQVAHDLRGRIESGQLVPGEQLPPEHELADSYSVNRHTLRRALEDLAEEGMILRQKGRGTFVAGPEERQAPAPILYVGEYRRHFYKDLYSALSGEGQRRGRWVNALDPAEEPERGSLRERMTREAEAGAPLICSGEAWPAVRDDLPERTRPAALVYAGGEPGPEPTYHLVVDRARATWLAASHLIERGHRRLAYIGTHPDLNPTSGLPRPLASSESYRGFRDALHSRGCEEIGALAYYTTRGAATGLSEAARGRLWCGTEEAAERLVGRWVQSLEGGASGFVCDADFRAITLCHVLAQQGVAVPDEISVVGVGNTPWCDAIRPRLTSISLGEEALARLAVLCVGAPAVEEPVVYSIGPKLVERGSVASR